MRVILRIFFFLKDAGGGEEEGASSFFGGPKKSASKLSYLDALNHVGEETKKKKKMQI